MFRFPTIVPISRGAWPVCASAFRVRSSPPPRPRQPRWSPGIDRTAAQLRLAGASVEDIELPDYALFSAAGRVIMMAEAFAVHESDMQTRLLDYGEITAGRFILGAAITAADFINALRARRELTDAVNAALARYDALLTAVGAEHGPALRSTHRFAVVGIANSNHPVQCHRPSGDQRADGAGAERAADRRADRRAGIR